MAVSYNSFTFFVSFFILALINFFSNFYFILILLFFGLIVTPLVFGCINVGKARDGQNLNPNDEEYSIFKNLNLAFVIIGIALVLLLIAYMILVPFKFGFKEESDVKVNNYINETNTNVIVNDFKWINFINYIY